VTSTERLHVLIAGGGLCGLALAQGLMKDGHTCEVFERDADDSRKIGYYLHLNADGGEALRRCLPEDLFELYAQTSRRTYDRRESIVLDDQLNELSSQPHLGPPNEGDRPHTGVHRRTCARSCPPGWAARSTPESLPLVTKRCRIRSR
jgi:2-polyprenyl-6-methoxyphenol hydroxylase-like FAD-dependent oxidoreductase